MDVSRHSAAPGRPDSARRERQGGLLIRLWRRFDNSALPLGLKWSMSIAALIVLCMGLLGFFLIQQQETGMRSQSDRFSRALVEQLARVAAEPLMAGDSLALEGLLRRHAQSEMVLGAALYDAAGHTAASSGRVPPRDALVSGTGVVSRDWDESGRHAVVYVAQVPYQDVVAGSVALSIDRTPLERDLRQTLRFLLVSTGLMILAGVMFAALLAQRLSRPISHLARAGELLDDGHPALSAERRDEIGKVLETFKALADGARRRHAAEATLSRYVSPQVAQRLLADDHASVLGGSCVTGSVLFCDIVGFTELSESRTPEQVAALLNDYFGYFALAAQSSGGTVDKFIGDAIMIVFGAPHADPHHAVHALTCGMLIQQLTRRINARRAARGLTAVRLRVGVSSGPMLAGNLGSAERMQYTVVGDTVNVAARLCGMAEPGGVLLCAAMLADGQPGQPDHYRDPGPTRLRGRRGDVAVRVMDVDAVARAEHADALVERLLGGEVP